MPPSVIAALPRASATVADVVPDWSACILAGGRGRRLAGRIKPLVEVDGRTILARQSRSARRLLACAPRSWRRIPCRSRTRAWRSCPTPWPPGRSGALFTALHHAATPHVLVLAGDLPFVTATVPGISRRARSANHDAVVPRTGRALAAALRGVPPPGGRAPAPGHRRRQLAGGRRARRPRRACRRRRRSRALRPRRPAAAQREHARRLPARRPARRVVILHVPAHVPWRVP